MIGFIFGIIILILGIIVGICLRNYTKLEKEERFVENKWQKFVVEEKPLKKYSKITYIAAVALGLLLTFLGCITSVTTGTTGVVTTFGKVENYTLEAGFHLKAPWVKVTEMDNRVQKSTIKLSCFSSDIQEVTMVYTLNYQIDKENAQEIYRTVGTNYYATTIEPNIAEAVKVVTAQYTAEQLVQTRSKLAMDIETLLETNLSRYNIKVSSTAIEDMDFTDAFTTAVENKQVAEQKKKQAEIEQAQALAQAENDKKIAETNAEAEAEVVKIAADSAEYQGQKEAAIALQRLASINGWTVKSDEESGLNKLYKPDGKEVTTEELKIGAERLIEYYYTQQWNGELPETVLGESSGTLIGLGK